MPNFSTVSDLPKLTPRGFDVVDLPEDIKFLLQEFYHLLIPFAEEELGLEDYVYDNTMTKKSYVMNMDRAPHWKSVIENKLKPILSQWINNQYELEFASFYGIRSYVKDLKLVSHIDRIATHHVSGIIIIDREGANWPLDIQDHNGNWHKVYAEPGQMILYESAVCKHGREEYFQGEYFRNCFIHYKLQDFTFVDSQ